MTMMMTLLDAIWDHIRWSRSMWICLLLLKQTDWVSPTTHRLPNKAMSFYFFVCSTRFPPKQKLATQWASEVGLPQTPPERSKTRTTRKCPCMAYTIHAPALKCFDPWTRSDLRQTRKRMSRRKAAKKRLPAQLDFTKDWQSHSIVWLVVFHSIYQQQLAPNTHLAAAAKNSSLTEILTQNVVVYFLLTTWHCSVDLVDINLWRINFCPSLGIKIPQTNCWR